MINIVLFGPPGSGKGTQSEKLIEKYGLNHLSTGDILRSEITNSTPLGKKAKAFMDRDVIEMVINKLDSYEDANGFIFDGFPRTREQARFLRHHLTDRDLSVTLMIRLEVAHEELVKRLLLRGEKTGRTDDEISIIENRIDVYLHQSEPVVEFYEKMRKYVPIIGAGTIDDIFFRICQAIDARI